MLISLAWKRKRKDHFCALFSMWFPQSLIHIHLLSNCLHNAWFIQCFSPCCALRTPAPDYTAILIFNLYMLSLSLSRGLKTRWPALFLKAMIRVFFLNLFSLYSKYLHTYTPLLVVIEMQFQYGLIMLSIKLMSGSILIYNFVWLKEVSEETSMFLVSIWPFCVSEPLFIFHMQYPRFSHKMSWRRWQPRR
jgi:hypothetical protein